MVNFIVGSAYWLPTLVPLAIEAKSRGMECVFFTRKNSKSYADITSGKKEKSLQKCCQMFGFHLKSIKDVSKYPGLTFLVEGDINGRSEQDNRDSGLWSLGKQHVKVSLVWNFDFFWTYPKYINSVDYAIFPNEKYAVYYERLNDKNLYLGNPKYEIAERVPKEELLKKFHLKPKKSYAVVFYPKYTYFKNHKVSEKDLLALYSHLRSLGISVIVKTRDKDDVKPGPLRGDHYFVEESVFSNTSIELLRVSRLAILFSSAALEECVMEGVPFIDIKVHKFNRLEFLHDKRHSRVLDPKTIHQPEMVTHLRKILKSESQQSLAITRDKFLFKSQGSCARILDHFSSEGANVK